MSGSVTDPRAHALRDKFQEVYDAPELPVPVESIAEDLLGLYVEEADDLECSGLLLPAERRIVLRADEPPTRRRFTLAHELGHWVCQVKKGHEAPMYCRMADIAPTADRTLEREANVFAAELLMPAPSVREIFSGSIVACASTFGVSEEAMHWRLHNLMFVADTPHASDVAITPSTGAISD